jgi:ABC-type multidrug transport system fused ATPase/permease subunit
VCRGLSKLHAARGRTTLLVAHRLSTVRHADKIIVMDRGVVIEEGNHDQLLLLRGKYSEMWHMQVRDEEEEDQGVAVK